MYFLRKKKSKTKKKKKKDPSKNDCINADTTGAIFVSIRLLLNNVI